MPLNASKGAHGAMIGSFLGIAAGSVAMVAASLITGSPMFGRKMLAGVAGATATFAGAGYLFGSTSDRRAGLRAVHADPGHTPERSDAPPSVDQRVIGTGLEVSFVGNRRHVIDIPRDGDGPARGFATAQDAFQSIVQDPDARKDARYVALEVDGNHYIQAIDGAISIDDDVDSVSSLTWNQDVDQWQYKPLTPFEVSAIDDSAYSFPTDRATG